MIQRAGLGRRAALLALAFMFTGAAAIPVTMIVDPPKASAQGAQGSTGTTQTTPGSGGKGATQNPPGQGSQGGGACGPFWQVCGAADGLKNPATAVVGGLSGLGLAVGGGLLAIGQQTGVRIMAISAASGGGILIGNGVITALNHV